MRAGSEAVRPGRTGTHLEDLCVWGGRGIWSRFSVRRRGRALFLHARETRGRAVAPSGLSRSVPPFMATPVPASDSTPNSRHAVALPDFINRSPGRPQNEGSLETTALSRAWRCVSEKHPLRFSRVHGPAETQRPGPARSPGGQCCGVVPERVHTCKHTHAHTRTCIHTHVHAHTSETVHATLYKSDRTTQILKSFFLDFYKLY